MEPYDWSKELNSERNNEQSGAPGTDAVPVSDPEPEAVFESWSAPAADTEPAFFEPVTAPAEQPAAEAEPAFFEPVTAPAEQPAAETESDPADTAQQIRPDYHNYEYSSGPAFTARPARMDTEPSARPAAEAPEKKTGKRSGGFWKKAVALALVCALLGGAAGFGGALLANRLMGQSTAAPSSSGTSVQVAVPRETKELSVITVDSGKLMNASEVYKANVNSTVGITTEITTNWWGYQSTSAAAGSGFILTEDGYILTNEHVIEKANTITVTMYDGTKYAATLIGYDVGNDIAVLKIDAKGLTPVTLGSSDALEVGDEVIAIGNPLGELTFSLTKGNVSALNRAVTLSSGVTMTLIQTDAAINSGNSGGALFNMYGEVVGITNAKYSSSGYSGQASIDNIGFAIPINSVREIVTSIIEKGYISTPYIGVTVDNVGEESQSYGMPKGAAIRSVEQGSPAEQAGLRANDIVTAIDGETITGFEDLKKIISASEPGDKLDFTVYRQGETLTLTVTVGEKTQSALPNQQSSQQQSGQSESGQGQNPWGGSGSNPWGSGSDGSDGSGDYPWGDSDPFSWFFGGGFGG